MGLHQAFLTMVPPFFLVFFFEKKNILAMKPLGHPRLIEGYADLVFFFLFSPNMYLFNFSAR